MQKLKKLFFIVQLISLFLLSLSVLAMYFTDLCYGKSYYRTLILVNGISFWSLLFILVVFSVLLTVGSYTCKPFRETIGKKLQFGLICFFKNIYGTIADVVGFFSLIAVFCLSYLEVQPQLFVFISLSIFILSFGLHWIFNGMNYKYVIFCNKGENQND